MGLIGYNDYQTIVDDIPSVGFKPFYGLDEKKPPGGELLKTNTQICSLQLLLLMNKGGGASAGGRRYSSN